MIPILLSKIYLYLASGAIAKGWGGQECYNSIPLSLHLYESTTWVIFLFLFRKFMNGRKWFESLTTNIRAGLAEFQKEYPSGNPFRPLELLVGTIHVGMFCQLIYFKYNDHALIYLFQPCHMILLLTGIALLSEGLLGVLISLFILPSLTGTSLAMIFPEVTGLIQPFELHAYWVQHYLIQSVPLYLLLRRNGLGLKFANLKSTVAGLWLLAFYHFVALEVCSFFLF
jgi:hypothetical protein